ncbi:MAG: hypothetical protein ACYTEQ_06585 [Planctomycetota bacterium]|jgi:hypothetical protein
MTTKGDKQIVHYVTFRAIVDDRTSFTAVVITKQMESRLRSIAPIPSERRCFPRPIIRRD